jgi:Na+-transporting methylmalonyl-CoA/oxaloacetate decarboxylase gamma subunit
MRIVFFRLLILVLAASPMSVSAQSTATTITTQTTPKKKKVVKKKTKALPSTANAATKKAPAPEVLDMPVMTFKTKQTDFGSIKTGDKPLFAYEFTNTGNKPLDIDIVSGCDCTELDWTRTTVNPGEKGFVKALYNTLKAEPEDHKKPLKKTIDIVLKQTHPKSTYPLVESLIFNVLIID